jgi:hypothetical protein
VCAEDECTALTCGYTKFHSGKKFICRRLLAKFYDFIWNTCSVKLSKLVTPCVVSHNIAQFCSHGCEEITLFFGVANAADQGCL